MPGHRKQRITRVTRFFHQRFTCQMSSESVSISDTRGGLMYTCVSAVKNPTPISGVSPVNGAATSATRMVSGWPPAIIVPSMAPPPVSIAHCRLSSPAFSTPALYPTKIMLATIASGMAHPIIFQMGAPFGITLMDSSLGSSLSPSMMPAIPFMWPAPTTATTFWPGAFLILLARNWSRSSISTCFTSGKLLPNSCIMELRASCSLIFASSSSLISVLSKMLAKSPPSKLNLRYQGVQAHVRRSVILMSRSARTTGISFSLARSTASLSSDPGFTPVCSPILFW